MPKTKRGRLLGIKQGVGAVNRRPFSTSAAKTVIKKILKKKGSNKNKQRTNSRLFSLIKYGLNAMHPTHLPLPRAVGGYSVIKTTDIISLNQPANLFGCFKGPAQQFTDTAWLSTIFVSNREGKVNQSIGLTTDGGNAYFENSQALEASSITGARMVPAAYTVQIMNTESMQNADGICYIGRAKTVLDLFGDSRTWDTVMKELVSYSAPRLCSGGKLALRGVEVNAVPNNMSVLSDFVPRRIPSSGDQIWGETGVQSDIEGFGPIFVYNPNRIQLQALVTIEWRMRFDPLNPAYAGHTVHTPAAESTWSKVISYAEAAGNGVRDIADVVADIGRAADVIGPRVAPFLA